MTDTFSDTEPIEEPVVSTKLGEDGWSSWFVIESPGHSGSFFPAVLAHASEPNGLPADVTNSVDSRFETNEAQSFEDARTAAISIANLYATEMFNLFRSFA